MNLKIGLIHLASDISLMRADRQDYRPIKKSYQNAFKTILDFPVPEDRGAVAWWTFARKLYENNLDILIIVASGFHPADFLQYYEKFEFQKCPKVVFYLEEDFSKKAREWVSLYSFLKRFPVLFYCRSLVQKKLVEGFFTAPVPSVKVYRPDPFEALESFDSKLKTETRSKLGVGPAENLYVCAERMTRQNNTFNLARVFLNFVKNSSIEAKLIFIGDFDDYTRPLVGDYRLEGDYWGTFRKFLSTLSKEEADRIIFKQASGHELTEILQASDCYVSVSAMNDWDYAHHALIAGSLGLPLILSDWGAHKDLLAMENSNAIKIPMELDEWAIEFSQNILFKTFFKTAMIKVSDETRLKKGEKFRESYMNLAADLNLEADLDHAAPISDLTDDFKKLGCIYTVFARYPFKNAKGGYNNMYGRVYKAYIENL